MKSCINCGNHFPNSMLIDHKLRNLQNRTKCLACLPFMHSVYCKKELSDEQKKERARSKSKTWYERKKQNDGIDPIRQRRTEKKKYIIDMLGGSCQFCGYNKTFANLAFHHLYDKRHELSSRRFQYALASILPEIRKCVLACHNCHGEIHQGLIGSDEIMRAHSYVLKTLGAPGATVSAEDS